VIDTTSWSNVTIDNTPPTISIDDDASGTPTTGDTISVIVSDATAGIAETKWIVSDNATCDATKDALLDAGTG